MNRKLGFVFTVMGWLCLVGFLCVPGTGVTEAAEGDMQNWWQPHRGLGVGHTWMGVGIDPEDLNEWLLDNNYEEFESFGMSQTTLYWSFNRKFHLGLAFYAGDSGWQNNRWDHYDPGRADMIYGSKLDLSGMGIVAEYKHRFANDRWMFHAGGGIAVYSIELTLEDTTLGSQTLTTRYTAGAGALQLNSGIQYNISHFVGVDLELGILGISAEEVELGGEEEESFPDLELEGAYIGLGLKIHV
ncbi:hypothetical protein ACFL27_18090 [candidate division CSSED10-310 bacterium]|uniref:Outer membrane protein beta-barrel domain-containing protein n=1 Tax=candidate division CSSED10-310 bacterium TaxID=2855610 RepID=A0ABV6Z0Z9_UNCC1